MVRRQQMADRALRPAMRSPGRPIPARHVEREFWRLIAAGKSTEEAAVGVGVSVPVGSRWFRHAGGMTPLPLAEPSGRYLSFAEREELALLRAQGLGVRACARKMGRAPSTISRELRRNAATRGSKLEGYGVEPPVKNGPALGGYGAIAMKDALQATLGVDARRTGALAHLGPRQGAVRPRPVHDRHRHRRVLRRSALAMAARHQREHQRPSSPILPKGNRPLPLEPRRRTRRPRRAQRQTPQGPRLEDPGRSSRRTATVPPTGRCCNDWLNSVNIPTR